MKNIKNSRFIIGLVCWFVCFFSMLLSAQSVQLKRPLTEEDNKYLKKQLLEFFAYQTSLECNYFNYRMNDLAPSLPATLDNVATLKRELKGNRQDASTCLLISDIYSRLKMIDEAKTYGERGIKCYDTLIAKYPDSTALYEKVAFEFLGGGDLQECVSYLRKAMNKVPSSPDPPFLLSMAFVITGNLDSAYNIANTRIHQYPDSATSYAILPVYYLYKLYTHIDDSVFMKKISTDSAIKMPLIDKFYQTHPNSVAADFLYHEARQIILVEYLVIKSKTDTGIIDENKRMFNLKPREKEILIENKAYFESNLQSDGAYYKYFATRLTGVSYLLLNQSATAIPYLSDAIKLFPLKNASTLINAAPDYNNLLTAYYMMKDTNSFQKLLEKKIKLQPRLDPEIDDYLKLAEVYMSRNEFTLAQEYCNKALALNAKDVDAILIMASVYYLKNDLKDADDYISKAYALDDNDLQLFLLYGVVLLKENDIQNSYEAFQSALKIEPGTIQRDIIDRFFVAR